MAGKRLIREQVVASMKGLGACTRTEDVCRRRGRCTAAFYRWKERLADAELFRPERPPAAEDDGAPLRS